MRTHYFRPGRDVPGFIFRLDGRAAGFLQRGRITPDHGFWPWAAPQGQTWGVDLLIGEADLTGQGLGPAVIHAFLEAPRTERPALRRVLIDPSPKNGRAIRASPRAGFSTLTTIDTAWGEVRLLALDVP